MTLDNPGKELKRGSGYPLSARTNTAEQKLATKAAPRSGLRFFQKDEPKAGRNYKISCPAKPPTFKEINAEKDRRFAEFSKAVQKRLPVGKKGAKRSAELRTGRSRAPACHCSISQQDSAHAPALRIAPEARSTRLLAFKRGMMIIGRKAPESPRDGKRGAVTEFSTKSRIRCAWAYLNAETEWLAMVTLTYPVDPDVEACRGHLNAWLTKVKRAFEGQVDYGWVIEATKKGRPHFHIFFGDGGELGRQIEREKTQRITRKGKTYQVCRGEVENTLVQTWLEVLEHNGCIDDDNRKDALAFQWGGIVEKLNSTDAAARYVSKEASKRTQKGEGVALGKGCFWRLARHLKGKPRWISGISNQGRHTLPSYSRMFDLHAGKELADYNDFETLDGETEDEVKEQIRDAKKAKIERGKKLIRETTTTRWDPWPDDEDD